jgi:hypothetical protein
VTQIVAFFVDNDKLVTGAAAVAAICISLVSVFFAIQALALQRIHNRKSLLPIGYFSIGDYEERIFVRLHNDGVGPLIIDKISVSSIETKEEIGAAVIDLMPDGIIWETFVKDIRSRALRPGKEISLISLLGDANDPNFKLCRDQVRIALGKILVKVEFHSVYDEKFSSERSLVWFARHKGEGEASAVSIVDAATAVALPLTPSPTS